MSRGYSVSPEAVSWSRSKGNIEISASTERTVLSNPIGRTQGRGSKKGEEEEPTRKRIRVACSRCRKRKIKCSGPVGGEDKPCENCKNAGANTSCAFELTGALKVDMSGLRYSSKDYLYSISGGMTSTLAHPSEHNAYSLGLLQYPAASYPGALRQEREFTQHSYAIPYHTSQDYCEYGQQVTSYDSYSPYSTAPSMLQVPSQNHTTTTNREQLASWHQDFHNSCSTYDDSIQSASQSPHLLAAQRSLITPAQCSGSSADTTSSAISERALPKLQEIPSVSPVPSIILPTDIRYWPDDYESQADGLPSRRSSQDMPLERSSSNQNSSLEQNVTATMGLGIYSPLPSTLTKTTSTAAAAVAALNNIQQHTSYLQHQPLHKYQYQYSTLKPPPLPPSTPASTMDAASLASIGNHGFTHLPYRTVDKCGTLQYPIHNGVRKAPSRIAMEVANGRGQRTVS